MIDDDEFAAELAKRLNKLLENPEAAYVIEKLIEHRVNAPGLVTHDTIQVDDESVGVLGILNGLMSSLDNGWGRLVAVYSTDTGAPSLVTFVRKRVDGQLHVQED